MANPFDDEEGTFLVLVNDQGQHSLWLPSIPVPAGWSQEFGPDRKQSCVEYVEENWTDLRPTALAAAAGSVSAPAQKKG